MKQGAVVLALGLSGCMSFHHEIVTDETCEYSTYQTKHGQIERNRCFRCASEIIGKECYEDMGLLSVEEGRN